MAFLELTDAELLKQCDVDLFRASGPGGQKRNKTDSAVRLRHRPTGLAATASEDRSQHTNRARAQRRLRAAIALHVRTELDASAIGLSENLHSCISSAGRIVVGRRDQRYWAAVAEVLDVFAACRGRTAETGQHLGVSTAALVSFLSDDRKVWERVNQMRESFGLGRLR